MIDRFDGWISGLGTSSGRRIVVGHWLHSPLGPFTDVMTEDADGHRTLLAPGEEIAAFVGGTYTFDEVVGTDPRWLAAIDPVARRVMPGVRTAGSAGHDRREFYGAPDVHRMVGAVVRWERADLGGIAPVRPPVRFGFGSAPATPSHVRITTLVEGATA